MAQNSIKKVIIFGFPLLIVLDLLLFSQVVAFVREASDLSVFGGFILLCFSIWVNFEGVKYIVKIFKSKE